MTGSWFWPLPIVTSVPPLPLLQAASTLHAAAIASATAPRTARAAATFIVLTFRLITHCVLQNTVVAMIDATYSRGR